MYIEESASGAGVAGTGESMSVWLSGSASGVADEGERTHSTDSLRPFLLEKGVFGRLRNSFVGDMREGVVDEGTSVPFRLARARGSMLFRLRWPPLGTIVVSTE